MKKIEFKPVRPAIRKRENVPLEDGDWSLDMRISFLVKGEHLMFSRIVHAVGDVTMELSNISAIDTLGFDVGLQGTYIMKGKLRPRSKKQLPLTISPRGGLLRVRGRGFFFTPLKILRVDPEKWVASSDPQRSEMFAVRIQNGSTEKVACSLTVEGISEVCDAWVNPHSQVEIDSIPLRKYSSLSIAQLLETDSLAPMGRVHLETFQLKELPREDWGLSGLDYGC